jgi:hypothetical protein
VSALCAAIILKKGQPKAALESRIFKDGAIYLFKRADYKKPTWFCRINIPHVKGYVYGSTKTTNEHQAKADDLFSSPYLRDVPPK